MLNMAEMWENMDFLTKCCQKGNIDDLRNLNIFDINAKIDSKTALHYASEAGHLNVVEFLIGKGAMVNCKEETVNRAPLHLAVIGGSTEIVKYLIKNGAAINQKDKSNITPLHLAAGFAVLGEVKEKKEQIEIVEYLMESGADINAKDKNGRTPLFMAVFKSYSNIVNCLLTYGADVNSTDNYKKTHLFTAIHFGRLNIAKILLNNGAEKDEESVNLMIKKLHENRENRCEIMSLLKQNNSLAKMNKKMREKLNEKNLEISNLTFMNKLLKEKVDKSDNFICHFCLNPPEASFMFDCGHLPFCETCSKVILAKKIPKCPVCNKLIGNRYRAYLEVMRSANSKSETSEEMLILD